jgi:predicted DNA-binding protein
MKSETTRTQIYLQTEQHKALKRIYAETGQRITESIRLAVEAYLDDLKKEDMLKMSRSPGSK